VRSGLVHVTISDLLTLESQFPGLLGDIDTCVWQIELIREQMKAQTNG
jgi:hypothetical protein